MVGSWKSWQSQAVPCCPLYWIPGAFLSFRCFVKHHFDWITICYDVYKQPPPRHPLSLQTRQQAKNCFSFKYWKWSLPVPLPTTPGFYMTDFRMPCSPALSWPPLCSTCWSTGLHLHRCTPHYRALLLWALSSELHCLMRSWFNHRGWDVAVNALPFRGMWQWGWASNSGL